ncbi:MAG: sensor histidine kinase [Gemmatimonadaceae bacterium]
MRFEDRQLFTTAQFMAGTPDASDKDRMRGLEAAVRRRDAVLAAISHAASRFIDTADWDRDIRDVLGAIGTAAEVDRVYLCEGYRDGSGTLRTRMQHEWIAEGAAPRGSDPAVQDLEVTSVGVCRWEPLKRGDVIHGRVAAMSCSERDYFAQFHICSVAAVPIFAGATWWGYVGFANDTGEREWSRSVIEAVQAAAATLGAAIYRKQAEERLRESEACFRRLSEAAFEGVLIHNRGIVLEANPAIGRIFGYDVEELRGKNLIDFVATEESRNLILEHMCSGSEERYEVTGRCRDGRLITVEITGRVTSYHGIPARVATIQDITERKQADAIARRLIEEQAARAAPEAAERRAAFLAEASHVLGMSFDYHTTLATLTRLAVPALADYCTVDIIGRDGVIERVGVAHVDRDKEPLLWQAARWVNTDAPKAHHLRKALVDGESVLCGDAPDVMIATQHIDQEQEHLLMQLGPQSLLSVPLRVRGVIVGALTLYSAESGRRYDPDDLALAQELALRAALAVENARLFHEAELATRARDQMLGVVAHDLRNPLGTMLMASELIEESLTSESPARRHIAIVLRSGERMNRLIQDLLDVRRIDSDRLSIEPRSVPAVALLGEATEMLRLLAAASRLDLVLDAPDDLPNVLADPPRIHQVLSNLIGNAIKFTPQGGRITLRGTRNEADMRVAVCDTGPGIPAEQLPHIFGQFWQGTRADHRGIGLGLAIAKGIVEAHRGRIWVESTVGEGSKFFFTLPVCSCCTS